MTQVVGHSRQLWSLVRKDLRREFRARMTWPSMLLFALLLALALELPLDLPAALKQRVDGSLLWLAIFVASTLGLDRSLADEHEDGCWDALRLYPVPAAVVFLAKTLLNFLALLAVTAALLPLFAALADAPLLSRPGPIFVIAALANLALAAVGTLVGALAGGLGRRGNLVALLLLPLALPVILAAGELTRLTLAGELADAFWNWLQLLGVFALVFTLLGTLIFEFLMEA